ncbi:hypothetical protein AGMMS49940_24700 [Spirochaetia bacterium]|nr:hypothetical protein AGMMS49940_24700 [Spirochaetia bacterium]
MEGLSKLTDSIFPIIALIVIAGVRILPKVLRRQVRNRDQGQKHKDAPQLFQEESPQKGVRGFQPWEDEYRDPASSVTIEEVEQEFMDDDNFSAWNLSVNDEAPAKPAPVVPSKPAELPAWLQSTVQPAAPQPTEASTSIAEAVAGDGGALSRQSTARHRVESRIRSLPPLQQGIVWAEILGAPKGL